ncbi:MAG: aminoglycoside phosphotransferase family protein [Nostoc sp.]|uniref:phosphotransferase family protein n=1 Tax=Nostoc sp. TaxID=1180 RepID=UPI002FF716B4
MTFVLSYQNIFNYLVEHRLCTQLEEALYEVEPIKAKNFNLLLTFPDSRKLLIKQERHNKEGKTLGEFLSEWRIQEFLQTFPELSYLRASMPEVLHFEAEHSIIVFSYLDDYRDLEDFYGKEKIFPTQIVEAIATILATIHRATFNRQEYQEFFSAKPTNNLSLAHVPNWIRSIERIGPEIFGIVPVDGLKFFKLYQRYESLGQAMKELADVFQPCCLTHNDLKLNNILLHNNWQQESPNIVRLIDWETSTWGDPAFDLGTLIASYLQIWLSSLVISKSLTIEESLRLAMTPLEQLQPSIAALTKAYFDNFPEILEHRPNCLMQVVQFAGFALIQQIQPMIQYQKYFGNKGICMLQVAKSLLCRPEQSLATVFGTAATELTQLRPSVAKD